jgi:hypothetical protein
MQSRSAFRVCQYRQGQAPLKVIKGPCISGVNTQVHGNNPVSYYERHSIGKKLDRPCWEKKKTDGRTEKGRRSYEQWNGF